VAGETATLGRRVGGGSETILLAGDNDVLRELTATLLRQNGFEVRTVPDGLAALREYGDRKGQIDLVILDLTLPPLTGAEAAQGLRRLDPGVRVLLISAEGNSGEAELVRPYREVDLVQAVRSALRASERRNKNLPG
jgi:DNA-binding response OmpR family regulator